MSAQTGIAWCDSTLNFWGGCTKVSPACTNCYAERDAARFKFAEWGAGKPRKQMTERTRGQAEKWNKLQFYECSACGRRGDGLDRIGESTLCPECGTHGTSSPARRRVFINSWSDWLDNEVPTAWLVDLLDRIRRCPNIDFLLLTKRVGNWRERIEAARNSGSASVTLMNWLHDWLAGKPPANVWVGSTVIDQPEADRDIRKLRRVPARIRFLSIEPMQAAVDLTLDGLVCKPCPNWQDAMMDPTTGATECCHRCDHTGVGYEWDIDWVIVGGESGANARPLDMQWIRSLVQQCKAAGVPILVKQLGRRPYFGNEGAGWADDFFNGGASHWRPDYRLPDGSLGVCEFRDREGRDINEWPEDLRVREFPA